MFTPLQPGASVAVVAPSSPVDLDLYQQGLAILAGRYRIAFHDPGQSTAELGYLMHDDQQRARQLNQALADPAIEAIFCARGGYGAMRILPRLQRQSLLQRWKPLIGFSDCTALHLWAAQEQIPTIHGPVITQLPLLSPADHEALFDLLEGRPHPLEEMQPIAPGQARGPLLGGNLSLICQLLGTPYCPDFSGRILLLEETHEPAYRIDRMLTQLRLAGILEQVAGIVVGELDQCAASRGTSAEAVLQERLGQLSIPVARTDAIGHGARNQAVVLGTPSTLDASTGSLAFEL